MPMSVASKLAKLERAVEESGAGECPHCQRMPDGHVSAVDVAGPQRPRFHQRPARAFARPIFGVTSRMTACAAGIVGKRRAWCY